MAEPVKATHTFFYIKLNFLKVLFTTKLCCHNNLVYFKHSTVNIMNLLIFMVRSPRPLNRLFYHVSGEAENYFHKRCIRSIS